MNYFDNTQSAYNQWGVPIPMILPEQAISSSKKNKEWKRACMDSLEAIGLSQIKKRSGLNDLYRMSEGKLSHMELSRVSPMLRDIQDERQKHNIPSFLKHYDLTGTIVSVMTDWLSDMSDKYAVMGVDSEEVNDYQDAKSELLVQYISKSIDMRIRAMMIKAGIDPEYNDFQSDEERQQYQEMIAAFERENTPAEIERMMNTSFKTSACIWGDNTLERDRFRFDMDEMDALNFKDKIISGMCFRHFFVGYDYYKPERWDPRVTFYSESMDCKFPQYGDYIGTIKLMTGSQVISRYGADLTEKEKKTLIGGSVHYGVSSQGEPKPVSPFHLYNTTTVPFKGYYDYQAISMAEQMTGSPMGVMTTYDQDGNVIQYPHFVSGYSSYHGSVVANMLSGESLRKDMFQVTEAYWVSYKKVYYVTYISETGLVTQDVVTDELIHDFLKENGITKITRCVRDGVEEPKVNTYFVDYAPEVRRGVKISHGSIGAKSIYLYGEPIHHQVRGDGGMYDFVLPVSGYIGKSVVERIQPWQILYNLSCNQLYNNLEKEIGIFFLMDIGFMISEYKGMGEKEDQFALAMDLAKSTGIFGVDTSRQNTAMGSNFNQYSVYDLSLNKQIESRMRTAEFAKSKAFEMVGLTPQALGQQGQYETADGIKMGINSSKTQTQYIYDEFEVFKRKSLDMHLAIAQVCHKNGQDDSFVISRDDASKAYIQVADEDVSLRRLGVYVMGNSKKKKELEQLKQMFLQMNIAGSELIDLAGIVTSDSVSELINVAKDAYRKSRAFEDKKFEREKELENMRAQNDELKARADHERTLEVVRLKGEMDIRKQSVNAAGRAADNNADQLSLKFVEEMTEKNLSDASDKRDYDLASRKLTSDVEMERERNQIRREELELKKKQLAIREKESNDKRFTSIINKN